MPADPTRPRLKVTLTRRLPGPVEARMAELFDLIPNPEDRKMTRDELAAAMRHSVGKRVAKFKRRRASRRVVCVG